MKIKLKYKSGNTKYLIIGQDIYNGVFDIDIQCFDKDGYGQPHKDTSMQKDLEGLKSLLKMIKIHDNCVITQILDNGKILNYNQMAV